MSSSYVVTVLSQDTLPPGRNDLDVAGMQFDPTGSYGSLLYLADHDDNGQRVSAIYALLPDLSWVEFSDIRDTDDRAYRDLVISPGGALGQQMYVTEGVTDTIMAVAPDDAAHTVWAEGFLGVGSISASADGNALYVSDFNGVYRIRPVADEPGPTIMMREPFEPSDGPMVNAEGVRSTRLVWTNQIEFTDADLSIVDSLDQLVTFSVSGSGSAIMLISFGATLLNDDYTITIRDTVRSLGGVPIDGDDDGISGGDAVFTLRHRLRHDSDDDRDVDLEDFTVFQETLTGP